MNRLLAYMDEKKPLINAALEARLPRADMRPEALHEAMRYSVLGTAKRIRALLCLMSAEACGGSAEAALPSACAIEFIHAYSLIHDDLPCMDNAEMRRGRLTCHKAFGEAMAVLAGDALFTLAFESLAENPAAPGVGAACLTLARAIGSEGMVGGQVLDLEGEGSAPDPQQIETIDLWKTSALIAASCRLGGVSAGADERTLAALSAYGTALGVMYQITDDLLDIESSTKDLGKTAGKDAKHGKATYPAALGVEEARELAKDKSVQAKEALKGFGKEALMLRLLVDFAYERKK